MEQDLIDLLVADHRRIEWLFAEIETEPDPAHRHAMLHETIAALARHTAGEEVFLQPALREHLSAEADIAAYEAHEHAAVEQLVQRLSRLDEADPTFEEVLAALLSAVRQHMQEEETELFPRLSSACPAGILVELATALRATR